MPLVMFWLLLGELIKKIYRDFFRWHNILNKKMDKHFKNWKMFNNAKISSSFLKEMNFWLKIDWRYLWFHSLSNQEVRLSNFKFVDMIEDSKYKNKRLTSTWLLSVCGMNGTVVFIDPVSYNKRSVLLYMFRNDIH